MKVLKRMSVMFALLAVTAAGAFGLDVTGTAPVIHFKNGSEFSLGSVFDTMKEMIENNLKINPNLDDFTSAWDNSSVFAGSGATQRGYQGYKLFAFTAGTMLGLQLPGNPFDMVDMLKDLEGSLNKASVPAFGLNPQVLTGQASVKLGTFLPFLPILKGLSAGIKFGTFDLAIGDSTFKTTSFGITANYQLFKDRSLLGLIKWRGLSVGSGFIWTQTHTGLTYSLGKRTGTTGSISSLGGSSLGYTYNPTITLDIDTDTYTIPLEVTTAIRVLALNVHAGLGADLAFGSGETRTGIKTKFNLDVPKESQVLIESIDSGSIGVSVSGDGAPTALQPKLMAGLGFVIGPAIIDIPLTYYFANDGFNVGITIGAAF